MIAAKLVAETDERRFADMALAVRAGYYADEKTWNKLVAEKQ